MRLKTARDKGGFMAAARKPGAETPADFAAAHDRETRSVACQADASKAPCASCRPLL
jgi:hypothetical protein